MPKDVRLARELGCPMLAGLFAGALTVKKVPA